MTFVVVGTAVGAFVAMSIEIALFDLEIPGQSPKGATSPKVRSMPCHQRSSQFLELAESGERNGLKE